MLRIFAAAIATVLFAGPVLAYESPPVVTKRATATLVADSDTVVPGGTARIGLRLRMAPGWHTYWHNPGEAGVPVEATFDLAQGAVAGAIEWPAPARQAEGPIVTYGYDTEVVLPVVATVPPAASGLRGQMHATWLVCKDICVPEEAAFPIDLPAGSGAKSAQASLFQAHDAAVPRPSPWEAAIAPDGTLFLHGAGFDAGAVSAAAFIPDSPGEIVDGAPQAMTVRTDGLALRLRLDGPAGQDLRGVLSLTDRAGMRTDLAVTAHPGPDLAEDVRAKEAPTLVPLARALGFAFLGGLILNLMPCVFPILALKAVGFAAGLAHGRARAHSLSYTGGVAATFMGIAAALLVARGAGSASGWGFQFASPMFVAGMAWLLFAVGLNLSGVFRIGAAFAGAGGGLAARDGHWGSFFTGVLAVLVATPCTAPFMAVAIAAGLAAPPLATMLVFAVMGVGLASPYLLLGAFPGLGRLLPRPGPWMEIFRQVLAFPMYGAAVWLLWVLSQEAGAAGVLAAGAGAVLLGFAGWVLGMTETGGDRLRRFGFAAAGCAALLTLPLLTGLRASPVAANPESGSESFSPARLASLRAEGRPVFVNMTAAWCVTCLVNERVALATEPVRDAFAARNVAYLKGDWTSQDPEITAFLRANGRDGVPLYLYYGPHAEAASVLPQVLTQGTVLAVLDRPSGG